MAAKGHANGGSNLNGQHPATPASDTSAPPEQILWKDAVREGREILAREREDKLRLGEIADKLEPKYDDRTLAKFAAALGISKSTLNHYRTTYRAWKIVPPGAKSTPYAVLEALATVEDRVAVITAEPKMSKRRAEVHRVVKDHPKRDEILSDPDLTCTKKARELMAGSANNTGNGKGSGDGDKETKRWFNNLVTRANEMIDEAAFANQQTTAKQRHALLMAADPDLLDTVRKAGEALVKLADRLDALLEEAADTVTKERAPRANAVRATTSKETPPAQALL
jgi:hypothetical protein